MIYPEIILNPTWKHYWSKYPEGYSIMENLIDILTYVNTLIDHINVSPDKVLAILESWRDDGTLENIVDSYFENLKTKVEKMDQYIYLADFPRLIGETDDTLRLKRALYQSLVDHKGVMLGKETVTISETLNSDHLHYNSIIGLGKGITKLKFVGDIDCFDLDAVGRFYMNHLSIEVDPTNTKAVFKINPIRATCYNAHIGDDVEISCENRIQGDYTAIHVTATEFGSYSHKFGKITIYGPRRGVYFDSVSPVNKATWATSYNFDSIDVISYKEIAFGINRNIESGVQISDNVFNHPQAHDRSNTGTKRTAFLIDGQFNTFIAPVHWADNDDKDNSVGLEFINRNTMCYNEIIGGHIEGKLINKHMIYMNTCNFLHAGNTNSPHWTNVKSKIHNFMKNPNYENGISEWQTFNGDISILPEKTVNGRKLRLLTTGTTGQVYQTFSKSPLMIGQKIVLIAAVKTTSGIRLTIDEGSELFSLDFLPEPGATGYRTVAISKTLNVDNNILSLNIMSLGGAGSIVDIAYFYALADGDQQTPTMLDVVNIKYGI